jgi:hypothetical protein
VRGVTTALSTELGARLHIGLGETRAPVTNRLTCRGHHLAGMVPSHPTRVKFLLCLDPARWRAGPLAPQSHFAVPTMEGMALGPSPVRTLASLAAHDADAQKYTGPSTAEGKAARFLHGTKLPMSLETKGGGETKRGTKLPFRHGGEEENWAGKAAAVAFRKCVDLFSESRSQVAFAVYQGMASAQYCSLNYPNASCDLNSDLAQFLAAAHRKLALLPPHASRSSLASAGDHALGENFLQQRFMEPLLLPRGE